MSSMPNEFDPIVSKDTSAAHGPNEDPVINNLRSELRTAWAKVSRLEQTELQLRQANQELENRLDAALAHIDHLIAADSSPISDSAPNLEKLRASVAFCPEVTQRVATGASETTETELTGSISGCVAVTGHDGSFPEDTLLSRSDFAVLREELKKADLRIDRLMAELDEARQASSQSEMFKVRAELQEARAVLDHNAELEAEIAELRSQIDS